MPLISLIVPVYNTEKYLKRCLDSLINQSFKDIEIIIVNDGSTDGSKKIIEEYLEKDNRIKYIEQEKNKGLLQARKVGNIHSSGKYVAYVDSDDEIELNTCSKVYSIVKDQDYDIVHIGVKVISEKHVKEAADLENYFIPDRNNDIDAKSLINEYMSGKISHNIWGKFLNRRIVQKLIEAVPDITLLSSEDMFQALIVFYFSTSYFAIKDKLYHYYYDIGMSNQTTKEMSLEQYESMNKNIQIALKETYQFLLKNNVNMIYTNLYLQIYYNNYKYLLDKIENNDFKYLNILGKYFNTNVICEHNKLMQYKYGFIELNNKCNDLFSRDNELNNRCNDLFNKDNELNNRCNDLFNRDNELYNKYNDLLHRNDELTHQYSYLLHRSNELSRQCSNLLHRNNELNDKYNRLNNDMIIRYERLTLNINLFKFFGVYRNSQYIHIYIFGIRLCFKIKK